MGRFLRQAIDSIFEQTDPNIECIIIDDVSTDESAVILLDISKQYPSAAIFRRNDNGGQTLAAQEGFNAVRANMWSSSTRTVFSCPNSMKRIFSFTCRCVFRGFTSADVLQTVESRIVFGTYFTLSEYVRSGRGKRSDLLRRIDESACDLWPLQRPEASIESQVHLVEPGDITGWYWAPMSANCFRRDALRLFLLDEGLAKLRGSLDGFLLRAMSWLLEAF